MCSHERQSAELRLTPNGLLAVRVCDDCPNLALALANITARAREEFPNYSPHFQPTARAA